MFVGGPGYAFVHHYTSLTTAAHFYYIFEKVFKNGPNEICGRQPLKILKGYGLAKADHILSNFLKTINLI